MKILVADYSKSMRKMLLTLLEQEGYEVVVSENGKQAWDVLQGKVLHLAILDFVMPDINGLELLGRIRNSESIEDLPVLILTSSNEINLKAQALDLGAADLLNKPFSREDLLARVRNMLRIKSYQDWMKTKNGYLEQKVKERTKALVESQMDLIWRLGRVAEFRDSGTGNHIFRVGCYCQIIAKKLGMEQDFADTIFLSSQLHDIGKIGIPDNILLKEGPLSADERELMKNHCSIGAEMLRQDYKVSSRYAVKSNYYSNGMPDKNTVNPTIDTASTIALTHHERWNGNGYPFGLIRDEIPLESRIVAIADVYDALRAARPYKPAYSERETMSIMKKESGRHFDPHVYSAFENSYEELRYIQIKFSDELYCKTENITSM
ncbi:MAG: response regulator [Candidatus Kuenenia sp.]|nr:response regulator [Candidatus Kuenenia hertensis]